MAVDETFSIATMPGAVLGALATTAPRTTQFFLWLLLLAIAAVLVISPGKKAPPELHKAVSDRQSFAAWISLL